MPIRDLGEVRVERKGSSLDSPVSCSPTTKAEGRGQEPSFLSGRSFYPSSCVPTSSHHANLRLSGVPFSGSSSMHSNSGGGVVSKINVSSAPVSSTCTPPPLSCGSPLGSSGKKGWIESGLSGACPESGAAGSWSGSVTPPKSWEGLSSGPQDGVTTEYPPALITTPTTRGDDKENKQEEIGEDDDDAFKFRRNGKPMMMISTTTTTTTSSSTNSSSSSSSVIPSSVVSVCLSILMYCFVSVGIVFLNRKIFSDTFQYPVFVSWFQQIVGLVAFKTFSFLGSSVPFCSLLCTIFPVVQFDRGKMIKVLPLSVSFVGMIAFSNTCLKYVQVSTYQVARALTLLFNLILTRFFLKSHVSRKSSIACGVVMSGFVVGSMDPETLGFLGVFTGAVSSLFQAFYMVLIKKSLAYLDNDQNALLCYNLLISSFLFFPLIFVAGEHGFVGDLPLNWQSPDFFHIWGLLLASGALGIFLTMATYWCVRVTSPVTFNVVGYAKACLQSLGGILLLQDIVTFKSLLGILLTLAGSFWYSQVKMVEMATRDSASPLEPSSTTPTSAATLAKMGSGGVEIGGRREEELHLINDTQLERDNTV